MAGSQPVPVCPSERAKANGKLYTVRGAARRTGWTAAALVALYNDFFNGRAPDHAAAAAAKVAAANASPVRLVIGGRSFSLEFVHKLNVDGQVGDSLVDDGLVTIALDDLLAKNPSGELDRRIGAAVVAAWWWANNLPPMAEDYSPILVDALDAKGAK